MSYVGVPPFGQTVRTITEVTATAGQTAFTPSGGYLPGYVDVSLNGIALSSADFTATNGTTVTLAAAAAVGDEFRCVAYWPVSLMDTYRKTETDTLLAAKQNSLGYTPVNKAGDTMTGRLTTSAATGQQLTLAQWGDASSADGGQTMIAGNAYFDKTAGTAKFSNSHGTIGATGIRFNSPSWNEGSLFTAGVAGSTAGNTFTPVDALRWDTAGRVLMPNQPAFCAYRTSANPTASAVAALDVTRFNRGGCYNTSTYRFTAPVTGVYWFDAVVLPNTSTGFLYRFRVNGSVISVPAYNVNADESVSMAQAVFMNSGDYFELFIDGNGFESAYTQLSGYLIG